MLGVRIKRIAIDYFSDLFTENEGLDIPPSWPNLFGLTDPNLKIALIGSVIEEEMRAALFSIGPLKAPDGDGLQAIFYHRYWDLCKKDLVSFIQRCFVEGSLPEGLNATLITLVP